MKNGIKPALIGVILAAGLAGILLSPGCTSLRGKSEPVDVQAEIAAFRAEELDLVRETISDGDRTARFIKLLEERDRVIAQQVKEISAYREQIAVLNADYSAEREEFEMLIADFNRLRAEGQTDIVDLIAAMKDATTTDEWKAISKFQIKRLNPRQLAYGQAVTGD